MKMMIGQVIELIGIAQPNKGGILNPFMKIKLLEKFFKFQL